MRKTILVASIVIGVLAAACGPLLGLALAGLAWLGRREAAPTGAGALAPALADANTLQSATVALTLLLLGFGLGLALAWAGWRALQGAPARAFRLPHWAWWLLATVTVLAAGQAAFSAGLRPLMPILHLLAGILPPFFFVALAAGPARRQRDLVGRRAVAGSLAWGGLGGTGIALALEVLLVLAAVVGVAFWLAAVRPELAGRLAGLAEALRASGGHADGLAPDLSALLPYARSPWVVLGGLAFIGLLVPLIEEGAKSLAVPLAAAAGRRPTRLDAFLLGVAAGAGFALLEGIVNGSPALASANSWAALMALRGGTAAMHCLATGLAGLGWQAVLVGQRRWGRGLAFGAAGVAIHGLWNAAAGVAGLVGLLGPGGSAAAGSALSVWVAAAAVAFMALLWLLAVVALGVIPYVLARVEG